MKKLPIFYLSLAFSSFAIASLCNQYAESFPFHASAYRGDIEAFQSLIDRDMDIHEKDPYGRTPLHFAARFGNIEILEALIDEGAQINAKDRNGYTPLHVAAMYGYTPIIQALKAEGATK